MFTMWRPNQYAGFLRSEGPVETRGFAPCRRLATRHQGRNLPLLAAILGALANPEFCCLRAAFAVAPRCIQAAHGTPRDTSDIARRRRHSATFHQFQIRELSRHLGIGCIVSRSRISSSCSAVTGLTAEAVSARNSKNSILRGTSIEGRPAKK
jgi:hypothetical protein